MKFKRIVGLSPYYMYMYLLIILCAVHMHISEISLWIYELFVHVNFKKMLA